MWQRVVSNWNLMRIIRLGLGIMVIVQSIQFKEYWFVLIGLLLAGLALFDMGCASGACGVPPVQQRTATKSMEEIEYEEVGK